MDDPLVTHSLCLDQFGLTERIQTHFLVQSDMVNTLNVLGYNVVNMSLL